MSATAEVACQACGGLMPAGAKFCMHCGTPAQPACPSCGEAIPSGARFCMQCGTRIEGTPAAARPAPSSASASGPSVAERRLVSVLFADLVGFTTMSEHRDPEEVRELLSQYFERCRTIIARYGGTVEKFIGDAVMAVWGTPVAREDDAERAVRAALALTSAVTALGEEVNMPTLRVRAGVLTGNAAVEVGAEGEGMVLGDTVNTASRLQSLAEPGTVLVDDVTRRSSEAAIAYEDAGSHQVKGRDRPVHAWTALRVVAGTGGSGRSAGLEAPLSGRDAELRALIEAGERSAHTGRAELVAIVGEAGSGKSRLLWEYYKYLDGIEEVRWWHQGRCLSYGEGVAYWALAEMVRGRARIAEEDPPGVARQKLREAVELHVPDERERRLVEPRLAHLLRLEERPDADRADLFSGWRLFLERMAERQPLTLAFEDLQWADSGLLDFIDYLLEWSAEFPILVFALGRTELLERRPNWDPINLRSLEAAELRAILDGLVPGLPESLATEIVHRAEGIPLYAVETIRMLQDRGLLVQQGAQYVLTGDVEDLEVPETLHALVASRLDGLSAEERTLLQNASVLGHTFSPAALAAVSERREEEVRPLLDGLVAKQVLSRDDDPRSPERGQYAFLQALLRTVAYGTLGRRTRKARHLAAARYLRDTWPGELSDIAEVLASHYLEAIRSDPEAADVAELRASARETLAAAGRAAASLALGPEAERYFEQAAELAEDDRERASLFEQAGSALYRSGDPTQAQIVLRKAVEAVRATGDPTGGSAAVALGEIQRVNGEIAESMETLGPFRNAEATVEPVLYARALIGIGMDVAFLGNLDEAGPLIERALMVLEDHQEWPALGEALIGRGVFLVWSHRRQEGLAVCRHAQLLAEEHDLPAVGLRARYNIAGLLIEEHRLEEAVSEVRAALAQARERGDRSYDALLRAQSIAPLVMLGRWDEAWRDGIPLLDADPWSALQVGSFLASVAAARGEEEFLVRWREDAEGSADSPHLDMRYSAQVVQAVVALESGDLEKARTLAAQMSDEAPSGETTAEAFRLWTEVTLAGDDDGAVNEVAAWVEARPPARRVPLLWAGRARLRAEEAHRRGDEDGAKTLEAEAEAILRGVGARPLLAAALLDRVRRRADEAALAEAREIVEELGATRWLARIDALGATPAPAHSQA